MLNLFIHQFNDSNLNRTNLNTLKSQKTTLKQLSDHLSPDEGVKHTKTGREEQ